MTKHQGRAVVPQNKFLFTEGRCAGCGRLGLVWQDMLLCAYCTEVWMSIERKLERARRLMQPWSWLAMDANTEGYDGRL